MNFGDLFKQAKEEGAFADLIPDGDYVVEIARFNAGETKSGPNKGRPKLGLLFKTVPEDSEEETHSNWVNLSFSEKAAGISFRLLKDLGLTEEFIADSDSIEDIGQALVGARYDAEVGHRPWNDGDRVDNTIKVHEILVAPSAGSVDPQPAAAEEEPEF